MSLGHPHWRGRRKRTTRRVAHDARQLAPIMAIALCFAGSATAILVVHRVPDELAVALPSVASAPRSLTVERGTQPGAETSARSAYDATPVESSVESTGETKDAAGCPTAPLQ